MDAAKLLNKLADLFAEQAEKRGDGIYFPTCKLTVRPEVINQNASVLALGFNLSCPAWDRDIYETCSGIGDEEKALSLALGSFVLGVLDGVKKIFRAAGTPFCDCDCSGSVVPIESSFLGTTHHWQMAKSSIVCMGETPDSEVDYWTLLKDDIIARLGNQKIFSVRVFVARGGETCTGECRINDIVIDELGEKLKAVAESWETTAYGSHKQYFFFLQDEATYIKHPNTLDDIKEGVDWAIQLLSEMKEGEGIWDLAERLISKGIEPVLAEEISTYLPEMSAEKAFSKMQYPETITFMMEDQEIVVYKSQLADYYPILQAFNDRFYAGKISQAQYSSLITMSSVYSAVLQVEEAGENIEDCSVGLCFQPSDSFHVR